LTCYLVFERIFFLTIGGRLISLIESGGTSMLTNLFRSPEQITIGYESSRLSSTQRLMMTIITFTLTVGMTLGLSTNVFAQRFQQTNLVSDVPGLAATTDPNLVNPWGLARSASSPWWVADNGRGVSTLYDGNGGIVPLVVTIPVPPGGTPPRRPPAPSSTAVQTSWETASSSSPKMGRSPAGAAAPAPFCG